MNFENAFIQSANPRKLFKFVNNRINSAFNISKLVVNGKVIENSENIADEFIYTFSKSFTARAPPFPALPSPRPSDTFIDLSPFCVSQFIKKLSPKLGYSSDSINFFILKNCADAISVPLSLIFTESLTSKHFPSIWKTSIVVPLHKKGSSTDPTNFRPISLTHPLARLFEKIVIKALKRDFTCKLSQHQFGFLDKRSCPLALLDSISEYQFLLDSPKAHMDVIFIDFKKAFDSVPHDLLMLKMLNFGIHPNLCDWFRSFLSDRISKIKIGNYISSNFFPITSGVLQGTVTGPFLFLIYIDDLLSSFPEDVRVTAFADDIKLFSNNSVSLQKSIDIVVAWCTKWKLALANNKTLAL
uniref:Reverse transcriptase domain-containing protein n=1 Tax=Caenorhabditis japonica TaxID=281687 RepID=A0A8R1EG59_CAEJA